jgi:hypothetical protein
MTKEKESSEYFKRVLENGYTKDGKNFDELIKEKPAFVKFHSKMCGHCKNMASEWDNLDRDPDIKALDIYVIEVDVDGLGEMTSPCKNGTNEGVPYITMVNKGDGTVNKDYSGRRDKPSMKKFIMEMSPSNSSSSSSKKKGGGGFIKKRKSKSKRYKKVKNTFKKRTSSKPNKKSTFKNLKIRRK